MPNGTGLPLLRTAFYTDGQQVLHFHISKILAGEINPLPGKPHAKPLYEFLVNLVRRFRRHNLAKL